VSALPVVLSFGMKYSPKGAPIKSARKNQSPLFCVLVTNSTEKHTHALLLETAIKTGSVCGIQGVMSVFYVLQ
jgi:hypothetical protein